MDQADTPSGTYPQGDGGRQVVLAVECDTTVVSGDAARPFLVCMCFLHQPRVAQDHPSQQG